MKIWYGVSGDDDHKPTDFDWHVINSEDELADKLPSMADYLLENLEAFKEVELGDSDESYVTN